MKKMLKILGLLVGVLVFAVAGLLGYAKVTPMKTLPVNAPEVKLPTDSASLAFGKKIVETTCVSCHLGADGKMSGRLFNRKEDPFGEMWSANITQHPTKGIGRYTDGEIAYILRTGINREGRFVGHMMTHPNMSDEHLSSVIAYLRSGAAIMQPSEAERPLPEYIHSAIVKAMVLVNMFPIISYEGKPISAPPVTDKIAYGWYLATDVFDCGSCHSENYETYNYQEPEKSPGFFGGGCLITDESFEKTPAANLTPSKAFGLGDWTEEQFRAAVKSGIRKDGTMLKHQMPRFAQLSDEEVSSIWAYLRTVPVLENSVQAVAQH